MSLNEVNSHPREPPSRSTSGMKAWMSWTHPIQSEWSESRAGQLVQSLVWTSWVQEKTELCLKAAVQWSALHHMTSPQVSPLVSSPLVSIRWLLSRHAASFFFSFHPHWIWCLFCSDCRLFGFFRHNLRVRAPWWMQSTDSFTHQAKQLPLWWPVSLKPALKPGHWQCERLQCCYISGSVSRTSVDNSPYVTLIHDVKIICLFQAECWSTSVCMCMDMHLNRYFFF